MESLPSKSEIWPRLFKNWVGVRDLHGVELLSISLLLNKKQAGRKETDVLWLSFMFDLHRTRVSKYLATLGHNNGNSVLYKALGCKAETVAVSMQIGT